MNKPNLYVAVVTKEMVEEGEILPIVKTISKLADLKAYQQLAISFDGYDDTAVEVWETPEVRKWCARLVNKVPYLFYYLEQKGYETQDTVMLCLNDYDSVFEGERISPIEAEKRGIDPYERPKHLMKIHTHQKSMRLMFAEIRKHAKQYGSLKNAEELISEMSERYGISTN